MLEFRGYVHHFIEARRDQAAEADDVNLMLLGRFHDFCRGDHHAHVDHLIAVAAEDDADDVLADVVDVPLHRRHQHAAAARLGLPRGGLFLLHVGEEVGHGPLHHASAFYHLRQKHLSLAEQIAHHLHSPHQRAFNDLQPRGIFLAGILDVGFNVVGQPFYQRVGEPSLHVECAPGIGLGGICRVAFFDALGIFDEPIGGIGTAVEEHVLDPLEQLWLDLLIDSQLPGVDDAHVHAGLDRVVEEGSMHCLAHRVVAAEGKRDVAHSARNLHQRHRRLDLPGGLDEVEGVAIVLLNAGGNGEDVGVEDDVLRRKADLFSEQFVGAAADGDLAVGFGCLSLLVKSHHHHCGPIPAHEPSLPEEFGLPLLQADRIDDPLSLHALQPRLQHAPSRAVNHDRHAGHIGLAGEKGEKLRHHRRAVEHPLIDVDVDDVGAVLHLLAGNAECLFVAIFFDQTGKGTGAGDIGAFANDREAALRTDLKQLEPRVTRQRRSRRGHTGRMLGNRFGDRLDVWRRGAAAAADDVEPALAGEVAED